MSGLTRAHELLRRGEDVLLLEASNRPGGVVRSERRDGFLLELGPNTVRLTPEIWHLVEDLDLTGEALLANPRLPRYVDFEGRLHPIPTSPPALIKTSLFSARGKLRLLAEPFQPRASAPEESVYAFFSRRLGEEVANRLVEPFVGGIFAGSSRELEVGAAFPTLTRWERGCGSLLGGALFDREKKAHGPRVPRGLLSFRDGLETLSKALAAKLGNCFRAETPVQELKACEDGWRVCTSRGERNAERVVVATSACEAAELVEPFEPETAMALRAIPHPFLAVLHLAWPSAAFSRRLDGFGHLVVPAPSRRILGAVWSSSLFGNRTPSGQALLTIFLGGARDPEAARLSDRELVAAAARDVADALGVREEPRVVSIRRYARSIPQYVGGHLKRLAILEEAESRWPGLRFLGNYRGGISVGDVVRVASVLS